MQATLTQGIKKWESDSDSEHFFSGRKKVHNRRHLPCAALLVQSASSSLSPPSQSSDGLLLCCVLRQEVPKKACDLSSSKVHSRSFVPPISVPFDCVYRKYVGISRMYILVGFGRNDKITRHTTV